MSEYKDCGTILVEEVDISERFTLLDQDSGYMEYTGMDITNATINGIKFDNVKKGDRFTLTGEKINRIYYESKR